MPLTPEGVRTWKFGTTRFRRGYDQREVDAFLELVEEELVDRDIRTEQGREPGRFHASAGLAAQPSRQSGTGQVSGARAADGTAAAAAFQLQMTGESSARTAWHHQPAFMLTFGVVAIMLAVSSVGYRLMQEPQAGSGRATATADSQASPLRIAGPPFAARAAAGSGPHALAPAPAPPRGPGRQGRAHSIAPVSAVAFGPHGPGQGDHPHGAWLAIDGHRRTAWHTRRYTTARFGRQNPGTGLLLDMGSTVTITAVRVTLGAAGGASLQIRIGSQPILPDLRPAATWAGRGGVVRMTLARPVRGRYVAVWFTRLPPGPAGTYQAAVHGIGVKVLRTSFMP
jgi:DivIVA domain-containing protein